MSNKLYIPEIGDEIKLIKDWVFNLYEEHRNFGLWEQVTGKKYNPIYNEKMKSVSCTLPKDTILAIDRIYIRKGASDFSSLSFRIISHPVWTNEKKVFGSKQIFRFWAELADCNTIEFEQVKDITKEIKISKWGYNVFDVQRTHSTFTNVNELINILNPSLGVESHHCEDYGYIKNEKVIKMTIDYDVITELDNTVHKNIFGVEQKYWKHKKRNAVYKLFTLNNEFIGEYKTFLAAKTNANKYLQTQKETK